MRERPILFSAPMVRAILEGRKTQTRRVVKLPHENPLGHWEPFLFGGQGCRDSKGREISGQMTISHTRTGEVIGCPYGQPGDRLWQSGAIPSAGYYRVRGLLGEDLGGDDRAVWINPEHFTWGFSENDDPEAIELDTDITRQNIQWKRPGDRLWVRETHYVEPHPSKYGMTREMIPHTWDQAVAATGTVHYRADPMSEWAIDGRRWRPSIEHSRIDLEVTGVSVERLQDISEDDARAEGCLPVVHYDGAVDCGTRKTVFRALWESINGPGSWDANPWVWVVEFRKITAEARSP